MNIDHEIENLRQHSRSNRAVIAQSTECGCYYCANIFPAHEVVEFIPDSARSKPGTAICPRCGIDSVIGSGSGLPLTKAFLNRAHDRWFSVEAAMDKEIDRRVTAVTTVLTAMGLEVFNFPSKGLLCLEIEKRTGLNRISTEELAAATDRIIKTGKA